MPCSRILLRLEIKDDQNLVDFNYYAPDLVTREETDKQSSDNLTRHELKLLSKTETDTLRGQRSYYNIIVETYKIDMSEVTPDKGKHETETSETEKVSELVDTSDKNIPGDSDKSNSTKISKHIKKDKKLSQEDDKSHLSHTIRFLSGNPAVEATEGFLHLYKEQPCFDEKSTTGSHMLCMFSIPATICLQDLLKFLGPVISDLEMIKVVKPGTPNEYMALLKFRTLSCANEFFDAYNGERFNSIEADICHLAFVAKIDCLRSQEGAGEVLSNAVELPVCAVCLEKMDESVEGVLSILCNHSFHTPCIAQCEDTICPVCRYTLTPIPVAGNTCFQCSNQEDLWICLICGEVGCGRYANGHAHRHFQATTHTYAMQLGSNRVWDYVGENYVHRLVLNKMDGKLVEVDNEVGRATMIQEEKIESLSLEYTYLLTTQLDSQREFFENKLKHLEEQSIKDAEQAELKFKKELDECSKNSPAHNKDKQILDKRIQLLMTKMTKLQNELEGEKEMNKCLRENQLVWQEKVSGLEMRMNQKEDTINELNEQVRDLMIFLDGKEQLQSIADVTNEELEESKIFVQPSNPEPPQQKSRRVKKK